MAHHDRLRSLLHRVCTPGLTAHLLNLALETLKARDSGRELR